MKFICVTGYAATGQTALYDLFREFDGYSAPSHFEFVLIKEAYGILDLENFLIDNWEILRTNTAIKDFLEFSKILNRKTNKFFQFGYNYKDIIHQDFFKYSEEYINNLTICTYKGASMVNIYNKSKFSFFKDKIILKIFKKQNHSQMYISQPSYEEFIDKTQIYLEKIFYKLSNKGLNTMVIDNAIPISNMEKSLKYFKDIKIIIVDRDARDTYIDLKQKKLLIGAELDLEDNISKYISWVKSMREKTNYELPNVMKINFEDLILDYDNTLVKISEFLGNNLQHNRKFKFLDPNISKKNIGIWKKYHNQYLMREIFDKIPEYCYD
jgi:hypothetical protein